MVSDKISLHRLHTMFSLLSLKRAYIVSAGRLVGVVAVPELTKGSALPCHIELSDKCLLEIIGAAQSFNRERANSISSSIGIDNQIYAVSDGDDDDDDEVVIGDFSSSKYNRINPSYSRIRNQTSEL